MRRCLSFIMAVMLTMVLAGCSATLSETGSHRTTRIKRDMAKEWKMAAEDWDRFWMVDHTSRLTPNNM